MTNESRRRAVGWGTKEKARCEVSMVVVLGRSYPFGRDRHLQETRFVRFFHEAGKSIVH